jgi:WD40 repeat protein
MSTERLQMSDQDVKNFCIIHEVKTTKPVRQMDFHQLGDRISLMEMDDIKVFKFQENGVFLHHHMTCVKHGLGIVKFLDDKHRVVHSSYKNDFHLRILDLVRKNYLLYLPDHSAEVTSISVGTPNKPNLIISTGKDKRLYLWSIIDKMKIGKISFSSVPIAAFHPGGNLFAVALNSHFIEIFDVNKMDEAVIKYTLPHDENVEWKEIKYSNDGNFILITTNTNCIMIVEEGKVVATFKGEMNFNGEI